MATIVGFTFLAITIIVTVGFFTLVNPGASVKKLKAWGVVLNTLWVLNQVYWLIFAILALSKEA